MANIASGAAPSAIIGSQIVSVGADGLTKTGAGTLSLTNSNFYSGDTTITGGTLLAAHATAGAIDALGFGNVLLNGGTLQFGVNNAGSVNNITFNGTTSTVSAGVNTATIGNSVTLNPNAVAQFGIAGDTGTLVSDAAWNVDPTATVVIAGGTLKDSNNSLVGLTFSAASTTVNSGATITPCRKRGEGGRGSIQSGDPGERATISRVRDRW